MRQISQLVAVLAKVTGLAKAGELQKAYQAIDQAIEGALGLDANIVRHLDQAGLLTLLSSGNGLDAGKAYFLANLLAAEGDLLALQKHSAASQQNYAQALDLCLRLSDSKSAGMEEELAAKIQELEGKLSALNNS